MSNIRNYEIVVGDNLITRNNQGSTQEEACSAYSINANLAFLLTYVINDNITLKRKYIFASSRILIRVEF